ncbi:MAG: outer membrane protein [Cryomorphaceae bacterium]|jgi:outer membrane protein
MLKRSLFLLVAVAAVFQMTVASAELKVGVYDNRKILEALPSVQKEFLKLNAEFEPKQKEISDLQSTLLKLKEDIEKNAPILGTSELQSKQLEYQSKRRELQLLAEDTERVFSVRRNEVARTIQSTVDAEVLKVAQEQSYDLILRSGVLYASPKVDITNQILKRLSEK